jgi:hypothetical protein
MKKFALLAAIAAALVTVGLAFAGIPGSDGVIHGCYKNNGDLRVIDPTAPKKDQANCKNDETALDWNQQGVDGPQGDAWTPTYGTAAVLVARGAGSAVPWATYSTTIGSPIGDNTGGIFRFTCRAGDGTCKVTLAADGPAGTQVFPRILIHKQELSAGPSTYCEYGDGADNNVQYEAVGNPLTFGIGGSLDCPGTTQAYPANGVATQLVVGPGYYDVWTTFTFKAA